MVTRSRMKPLGTAVAGNGLRENETRSPPPNALASRLVFLLFFVNDVKKYARSFLSLLIFVSLPQVHISLHCKTTELMHRAVCSFTSQLSLVLIELTAYYIHDSG